MINIIRVQVRINIERDGAGYYAWCPELHGVHVGGDTREECLDNAKDAVDAHVSSIVKHGDPLPLGREKYSVIQAVKSLFKRDTTVIENLDISLAAP